MAILCGPQDVWISGSNQLVCGYVLRVKDIRPTFATSIDIMINDALVQTIYTSGSAVVSLSGSEIWTFYLLSKDISTGTANIRFTVSNNPCAAVPCPDICIGQDLWSQRCQINYDSALVPTGSNCVQNVLKQPNSLTCGASHYIEYDFNILPNSFIDYVSTYMTDIINNMGVYLQPILPVGVVYKTVTYDRLSNKFRLYISYTASAISYQTASIDIPQALQDLAFLIAGILVFIIGAIIVAVVPGYGLVIGPIVAVAGTFLAQWSITNLQSNIFATGTGSVTDVDKIKIVQEYVALSNQKCIELHPGCCITPCVSTCNPIDMSSFNKCMGKDQLAEYAWDHGINKNFDQSVYDAKKNAIMNDSNCLLAGTCTTKQVADNIAGRETERTTDSNAQLKAAEAALVASVGGCWIQGITPGTCMLTAKTGKTIAIIGGVIVGGYLVFSLIKK